jgi:hypothetical protein
MMSLPSLMKVGGEVERGVELLQRLAQFQGAGRLQILRGDQADRDGGIEGGPRRGARAEHHDGSGSGGGVLRFLLLLRRRGRESREHGACKQGAVRNPGPGHGSPFKVEPA